MKFLFHEYSVEQTKKLAYYCYFFVQDFVMLLTVLSNQISPRNCYEYGNKNTIHFICFRSSLFLNQRAISLIHSFSLPLSLACLCVLLSLARTLDLFRFWRLLLIIHARGLTHSKWLLIVHKKMFSNVIQTAVCLLIPRRCLVLYLIQIA